MISTINKALIISAVSATALMGCGGGGGADTPVAVTPPAVATTIAASAVVKYVADVQVGTSESTEATNVSLVELAGDETLEPATI